jgi:hypothetical protein
MPEPDDKPTIVELFGLKVPFPKWAISLLAVVVTAAVALFLWQKIYNDPERTLVTLKDVNDQLARDVEEYGRHAMEEPEKHELFEDTDGFLALRVYKDHCVMIQRQTRDGTLTKLIPDLARSKVRKALWQIAPPAPRAPLVVHAATSCTGGCINPHPGAFRWWYGQTLPSGWVEVWRQWPEGCMHVQLFNPRASLWDTNANGSPRIRWTCCVH